MLFICKTPQIQKVRKNGLKDSVATLNFQNFPEEGPGPILLFHTPRPPGFLLSLSVFLLK
jgi:hypothetical protein